MKYSKDNGYRKKNGQLVQYAILVEQGMSASKGVQHHIDH